MKKLTLFAAMFGAFFATASIACEEHGKDHKDMATEQKADIANKKEGMKKEWKEGKECGKAKMKEHKKDMKDMSAEEKAKWMEKKEKMKNMSDEEKAKWMEKKEKMKDMTDEEKVKFKEKMKEHKKDMDGEFDARVEETALQPAEEKKPGFWGRLFGKK